MCKKGIKEEVWERDILVTSTKIFFGYGKEVNVCGHSRKHLIKGAKGSLKRLDLSYIGVLFTHIFSDEVHIKEIVRAFKCCLDKVGSSAVAQVNGKQVRLKKPLNEPGVYV